MKNSLVIAMREFSSLLRTPTAYLYLISFSLLANLLVLGMSDFFTRNQADLAPLFDALPWLALLLTPSICMGLWSEELRSGSIELLFTMPVRTSAAVLGKFLAAWTFSGLALASTLPLWITVHYLGAPDHGALFAGYLGAFLLMGAFVALGSFVSTTTRSQSTAFVLSISLGFLFLFSDLSALGDAIEATLGSSAANSAAALSLSAHFEAIARGVLTIEDTLFFGATIALFLGASVRVLEARRQGSPRSSIPSIAGLACSFLILALAVGPALDKVDALRFDLTQDGLHTLAPGSRQVAENIDYDITLEVFLSKETARKSPRFAGFAAHVIELAERFERAATGEFGITIRHRDPAPFSEDEDAAQIAGLTGQDTGLGGTGGRLIFGIAGSNSAGDQRRIPFLSPGREQSIEYEIARIVQELGHPERPRIGVYSALPVLEGGIAGTGWQIFDAARGSFDFVKVGDPGTDIPADLDVLVVLHPRDLDEAGRKALDAHAIGGGPMLIALDPLAEIDREEMDASDYTSGYIARRHSQLPKLLEAWGVELVQRKVVGDRGLGLRIPLANGTGEDNYVHYIVLESGDITVGSPDPVTASLGRLTFAAAGDLLVTGDMGLATPLIQSSESSMNLDVSILQVLKDPGALLIDFVEDGRRRNLALRVRGTVPSAYGNELPKDQKPLHAILLSDVDILSDNTWVAEDIRDGVVHGYKPTADNGRLFLEALGDLAGGSALGDIRPKARYTRPFSKINELERLADEEIARELDVAREREQELRDALIAAEVKLNATGTRSGNSRTSALRNELESARTTLRRVQEKRDAAGDQLKRLFTLLNLLGGPLSAIALSSLLFLFLRSRSLRA